jgi:hypothetical protein
MADARDAVLAAGDEFQKTKSENPMTVPNLWNASRLLEMFKQRDFTVRIITGHLREYTPRHLRSLLCPYFTIEEWLPVTFGILKRFSKSIAFVARLKIGHLNLNSGQWPPNQDSTQCSR